MNTTTVLAAALAVCAVALSAGTAQAQAPCAVTRAVTDSARSEAISILSSERPIVNDLRKEQGISQPAGQLSVSVVRDSVVCGRLASQLNHAIAPGARLAVLRVGPIYYARDPDQRLGTGVFADSTFRVVMRLGAAVEK